METGRITSTLRRLFDLKKAEAGLVGSLSLHHFFQGFGLALMTIIANAEFLVNFPIYDLPLVYAFSAVVLIVVGRLYAIFEHRLGLKTLFLGVGISILAIAFISWGGLSVFKGAVFSVILMVAYRIIYLLGNLEFWGLSAVLFDVRQSKRLFGLISAGDVPAKLLGYLSVSTLAPVIGIQNLLLVGAASFGLSLVFMTRVLSGGHLREAHHEDAHHHAHDHGNIWKRIFGSEFVIVLAILSAIAVMSLTVIDYSFLSGVKKKFYSDVELAKFLGFFFAIGKGLTIIIKLFFSGRIVGRLGIKWALLILPALLLVVSLTLVADHFTAVAGGAVFILFGILMMVSEVFGYALHSPVFLALFQPLDQHRRLQGHTVVKGLTDAISLGLAGAILYLLVRPNGGAEQKLVIITFLLVGLVMAWILIVFFVNKKYLEVLKSAVTHRFLEGSQIQIKDEGAIAILKEKLTSPYPEEVIYTLELLKNSEIDGFAELLPEFLEHESEDVVIRVTDLLEELKLKPSLPRLLELVHRGTTVRVREKAIITYCRIAEDESDPVFDLLHDDDLRLRSAAITGLMQTGGIEEIVLAGESLLQMVDSDKEAENLAGIEIIGELHIRKFFKPLLRFFESDSLQVRKAALEAAGKLGNPRLLPLMLKQLDHPNLVPSVIYAIPSFGDPAIPFVEAWLEKADEAAILIRMDIIRAVSKIRSQKANAFLKMEASSKFATIRGVAIRALFDQDFKSDDDKFWQTAITGELILAYNSKNALPLLAGPESEGVKHALELEIEDALERAFEMLEFSHNKATLEQVKKGLQATDKEKRANAIEILDNMLPRKISDKLLPLVEHDHREKLEGAIRKFSTLNYKDQEDVYRAILSAGHEYFNRWTLASTLFAVRGKGFKEIEAFQNSPFKILRQTASLTGEEDHTMGHELTSSDGVGLLEIEKVIILKSTALFSETPEEILVEVARILKAIRYEKGKNIFEKGELGDEMYIIYEGAVRIHDGDLTFGELKRRDFFGELALLDPEPRSASATAIEDCLLLELAQGPFYELMDERIEVSRGILKVLARRIRKDNQQILKLRSEIDGK